MSEQELEALNGAAPVESEDQPEVVEGEEDGKSEPDAQTESAKRRERRERQVAAIREEAMRAQEKVKDLEARLERTRKAAESLPEPKETDFDKYDDYVAAKTAYVSVKTLDGRQIAEVEAELAERRTQADHVRQQQDEETRENWVAHVADAKARYSDFEEVVFDPSLPITERVFRAVAQADSPADVAYQIALDKNLARSLAGMSDLEMGRAIGRVEASLSRQRSRMETKAPPPIAPVKDTGTAGKDPTKMNADEYRAWRQAGGRF